MHFCNVHTCIHPQVRNVASLVHESGFSYEAEIRPTLHAKKSDVVNSMMVLFYSIRLLIEVLLSTILGNYS